MALSPWPNSGTMARTDAIAKLKPLIDAGSDDDRVNSLGMVASALVERYAPDAPQEIKDESVIRCAGYIAQSDYGSIQSETIGPRDVTYRTQHAGFFRNSGAAALLAPWRVYRAGVIGGDDE